MISLLKLISTVMMMMMNSNLAGVNDDLQSYRDARDSIITKRKYQIKMKSEEMPSVSYVECSRDVNPMHFKIHSGVVCCWLEELDKVVVFNWNDSPSHYEQMEFLIENEMFQEAQSVCLAYVETATLREFLKNIEG